MLIENDGALFRGPSRSNPKEVYQRGKGWVPYADAGRSRGVEWGDEISDEEARALMAEIDGGGAQKE